MTLALVAGALKSCRKCGEAKPPEMFSPRRATCKTCIVVQTRAWDAANPDKVRAARKAWVGRNRASLNATQKRYRDANKDKLSAQRREEHVRNPRLMRSRILRYKYGISADQFDALWAKQGYRCAICGRSKASGRGAPHVDHDHRTGAVRGILCFACNRGIGSFGDDAAMLQKAIEYLTGGVPSKE